MRADDIREAIGEMPILTQLTLLSKISDDIKLAVANYMTKVVFPDKEEKNDNIQ